MRLIIVILFIFCAAARAQTAGTMDFVQGGATISAADGTRRPARAGGVIAVGESIETAADGEVHAILIDGGMLAVRSASLVKIDAFRAVGDARDESRLQLLRGALRAVTGWLAKVNPRNVAYLTPTATVGVRGTDFDLLHNIPGGGEQAGTHARVRDGAVGILSEGAEQLVNVGQAGHAAGAGAAPRLHERIPEFVLRSEGRNDARVAEHGQNVNRFMEGSMRERRLIGDGEAMGAAIERRRGEVERERGPGRADQGGDNKNGGQRGSDGPRGDGPRGDASRERVERGERIERNERIERPERPQRPERPERPDRPRRPN